MKNEGDILKFLKDKPVPVPRLHYCSTVTDREVLGGVDFIIMDFVEVRMYLCTYVHSFCVCEHVVQVYIQVCIHTFCKVRGENHGWIVLTNF